MRVLCGTDIVEIKRMYKNIALKEDGSIPSFITRCFTDKEIEYCMGKKLDSKKAESFSGRYAAKEAVSKALGTGVMTEGIGFLDIEILLNENGAPYLVLHGNAKAKADSLGVISTSVSISHDGEYAISYCTMLANSED